MIKMFFKKKKDRDLLKIYNRILELEKEEEIIDGLLSKLDTIINVEVNLHPKVSEALKKNDSANHNLKKKTRKKKRTKSKPTQK